jgi:hypothetical protein
VQEQFHFFLTLNGGECPALTHSPREIVTGFYPIGGWVDPSNCYGLFGEEKDLLPLPGIERRFLGCSTHRGSSNEEENNI